MATQWQTFPIQFRGGLISNASPLQQGTNAVGSATILQNFEPNKEGGYSKLKGSSRFSTTVVPGSGNILGCKVISSSKAVVARSDGSKTEYHYGTGTSWTSLGDGTALGGKVRNADFNFDGTDKVIFVDGVNYPAIFNNSTNALTFLTSPSAIESASAVAIFKNIAFYANGSTLNYSNPFAPDTFGSDSGSLKVSTDIIGLAVFREQLIIFGENSIHKLTGSSTSDFAITSITEKIGCLNADTIQEVGGDIMYMSPDGIRLLSATDRIGDFGLDIASDPIAKDVNTFINGSSSFSSIVIREKAQYRIFSFISSEQPEQAKGLLATKFSAQGSSQMSWATISGIKANVADSKYTGSSETIFFANDDGYIYQMETGSFFAKGALENDIEAIYESPYMPISDPQVRKTFYKLTSYVEPSGTMSLNLSIKFDFSTSTNTGVITPPIQTISSTGSAIFNYGSSSSTYSTDSTDLTAATYGGQLDNVYINNLIGSGKTLALRFSDLSRNPTFTLDTAILEYQPNDRQ